MPSNLKQETFSFKINIFVKLLLIIFAIMVINKESLYVAGFVASGILLLLLKGSIRNSWLKILSKVSYMLIAYLVLDFIFTNDIESALKFVGKLLCYLLLIVWLKDSTNLQSYLSDVYSATFSLGVNRLSRKIDSFFHHFNFFLISTIKLVSKFIESYDKLFPQRSSFLNLFIQVFLNTMLRVPETKDQTNEELRVINYRPFYWKENLIIIFMIIILGILYWSNCEEICRNILSK
jgi:hypothetical protein